jgi:hypothetical protein
VVFSGVDVMRELPKRWGGCGDLSGLGVPAYA